MRMELIERYSCRIEDDRQEADAEVSFFFNAIGTDHDTIGITTPDFVVAGTGIAKIDFLSLEMFHGVSEVYYYIVDRQQNKTVRGSLLKSRVRTDKINLPFLSIPIKSLE